MADLGEENKVSGVFGGVEFSNNDEQNENVNVNLDTNTDIENIDNVKCWNNKKYKFTSKSKFLE